MTREEAIKILINHTQYKCNGDDLVALDMAIEALEQEPCKDAISRQAMHIELEKWITYGEYKYSNATKYLYDRIDRLPSVNPQYTEDEIQKMQDLEQAEIEKAYELGKAVQPKTGHWIYSKAVNTGEIIFSECSACGHGESRCAKRMNYCPNCGARMTESEDR